MRGRRLEKPDRRRRSDQRQGDARPSRVRQRSRVAARIAPRSDAAAARGGNGPRRHRRTIGPIEKLAVQPGDIVSLLVGPRDGNHACDLTDLELVLSNRWANPREWSLARDVSSNILEAIPTPIVSATRAYGIFTREPVKGSEGRCRDSRRIVAGSLASGRQAGRETTTRAGGSEAAHKRPAKRRP